MAIIIKPYTAFPGDVIRSSNYNANFDTIYNDYNGNITNPNIANNAGISFSKLQALPSAQIIVGSAGNVATPVTMSGDATISNTGVVTVSGSSGSFLLPAPAAPTAYRQIALVGAMGVNAVVQVHNGTSVNTYFRTDTYVESESTVNTDITLGVVNDAAYADVGTGAQVSFTVGIPGRYEVICRFTVNIQATAAMSMDSVTRFRLTDGTNNKYAAQFGVINSATSTSIAGPLEIVEVFNFTTTGSKTVKLQKFNDVSANVNLRSIVTTELGFGAVQMRVFRVAES